MLKDLQVKDSNIRTNNIQQAQMNNQISMALDNNTRLWQRHKIDLKQLLLNTYMLLGQIWQRYRITQF